MPKTGGAALADLASTCARRLSAGEILAHPTSTVYGLGAAATPELDLELARLKGRAADMPLIRLAADPTALRAVTPGLRWDDRCEVLAEIFWPGELTLVLDDGSERGLAVRVDSHPVVLAILEQFGGLMSSTSLNRSGRPPASSPPAVREILAALPEPSTEATFIDVGPLAATGPSTIVSLRGGYVRLLRVGAVPREAVERALGEPVAEGAANGAAGAERRESGS